VAVTRKARARKKVLAVKAAAAAIKKARARKMVKALAAKAAVVETRKTVKVPVAKTKTPKDPVVKVLAAVQYKTGVADTL